MFIGARVAQISKSSMRAGVVTQLINPVKYKIKFDDLVEAVVPMTQINLINNFLTCKNPKDIGEFKTFPPDTKPSAIYMSKKPIVFGQAGIRAVWYWANNAIFDNKLTEPNFKVIQNLKKWGTWKQSERLLSIGTRNHSFLEFTNTIVHEIIHQINREIENAPYDVEGPHGRSFKRWIPIIFEKTGIKVTQNADADKDTEFDTTNVTDEAKTKPFIFVLYKLQNWYGIKCDDRANLPILAGQINSLIVANGFSGKVYAGISDLSRVQRELANSKNGQLNKPKNAFSPSLITLLAKTAKPLSGYRFPEIQKED